MTDSPGRPADEPRKVPTPPETAADDAGTPDTADAPEPPAGPAPDPAATAPDAPWTATDAPRLNAPRAEAASEDEPTAPTAPTADAPRGGDATSRREADASGSGADGSGKASADTSTDTSTVANVDASADAAADAVPGGSAAPDSPVSEDSPGTPDTGAPSAASGASPAADGADAAPSAAPVPPGWSSQQPPAASGWGVPGGSGNGVPPGWGAPHQQPDPQQPRPPQTPKWGAPGGPPPTHGWGAPGGPGWGAPPRWQGSATPAAKPGIIPLRPLGVGEVLDGAIAAMRAHWKLMIGLSLVVALVTQAIAVPAQWAILRNVDLSPLDEPNPDTDQLRDIMGPLVGSTAVLFVVMLLGQLVITGILTLVVSRAVLGKDITLDRAWQGTKPLLWRLLGVSALTPLIPAGLFLACLLPGLVLAALFGAAGGAVLVLGFIGGGVLFVYAYVLLALATPALILEKQTVGKALARSRKLVTGSWWRVCGILLLITILSGILGAIVQTPFGLATGFSQFGAAAVPDSFTDAMIVGIGGVIAYAITFPFNAGATALLYIDQRMRREALDLELARAAGLVPDDATPAAS
ncbi:hypothetical protein GCM10023205_72350 [Yinghuangia aomiensis]|uniref:Membrane domain of glycerophosphoryl diester phosphodiesterase n=1 Tax=Yinghuangia aomiensis TaxID=676205 RepID=A0ABP9I8C7_9ACTN